MLSAMAACWSASIQRDHICTKESPPASSDLVAYGGVLGDSAFAACGNSADYSAVRSCAIVRGRQASVRRANRWITSTQLGCASICRIPALLPEIKVWPLLLLLMA